MFIISCVFSCKTKCFFIYLQLIIHCVYKFVSQLYIKHDYFAPLLPHRPKRYKGDLVFYLHIVSPHELKTPNENSFAIQVNDVQVVISLI